jgi:hypothetical protein
MFNTRVVDHIVGEGKRGLDEPSEPLYIRRHDGHQMVGTLDVAHELLARQLDDVGRAGDVDLSG